MSKKSHHFLTLWPWPLTYDLEKLIRSGHYHYQCVYQIWEQSIPWFLSYRVNTIAGGGRRVAGGGQLWRKTITSPDPSDTGDIIITSICATLNRAPFISEPDMTEPRSGNNRLLPNAKNRSHTNIPESDRTGPNPPTNQKWFTPTNQNWLFGTNQIIAFLY